MLGGFDPIILFQWYKLTPDQKATLSKVPILSKVVNTFELPPIPIYLSENLTGLIVESEEKHIDIETHTETLSDGEDPIVNQKALNSVVVINMKASRESVGLTLLMAMADLILPKVTSKEYAITYLNDSVTVFGGLLNSFSVSQNSYDNLYSIKLELSKSNAKTPTAAKKQNQIVTVPAVEGTTPL